MTPINNLKQWFRNGLKPTQEQFWAWLDSYWHKGEEIPQTSIKGLDKTLENKAETSAVEAKANKDASGLGDDNVAKWKEALGVGEVPDNMATIDKDGVLGNVHTKEQITELLESSGTNLGNSDLKVPEGEDRELDLTGVDFRFKGVQSAQGDASFNKRPKFKSDGTFGMVEENVVVKEDLMKALTLMSDTEKEALRRASLKSSEGYSTGVPRVDFILPFKITKEIKGVQYISVIGSNLLLNTNDCEVVLINTATRQEWRVDVINTSASTTSQFSFGIDFESIPLGSYRLRVRNGTMTNIDTTSFEVMESVISRDLSGLNWQTWIFRPDIQNFTANGIRVHRPSKNEAVNEGDSRAQINAYKALSDIVLSESDANKNWNLIISIQRNNGFSHGDRGVGNKAGYIGVVTSDNLTESLLPNYGMKWQHQDTYNFPAAGIKSGDTRTSINSSLLISKKGAVISVFQIINGKDTLAAAYNIVEKLPALRLLFSDGGIPNGNDLGYSVDVRIDSLVIEN